MRRLVSLTAAVATIAPLSMLPATTAHAAPTPVTALGACPADPTALNANAATDALDVNRDITGTGTADDPVASLYRAAQWVNASTYYNMGTFGQGVDVALIDSGVYPVKGLDNGNVIQGPDFSMESQGAYAAVPNPGIAHMDTYGHGTNLAGIIAGRDDKDPSKVGGYYSYSTNPDGSISNIKYNPVTHYPYAYSDPTKFTGIAPGARVVSLKVADDDGGTDVTQVIAAVDWAVKHAHSDGMNIRVINLSYGIITGTYDDWTTNALSYAVDQAWKAGIVVVASSGNGGKATVSSDPGLNDPSYNRNVIAVGAYDNALLSSGKATVPTFSSSSSSTSMRLPDVSAPGAHILSMHVVGSSADDEIVDDCKASLNPAPDDPNYPNGPQPWYSPLRGNGRFVKASGTSQAAAVVSGAIALILSKNPELTPGQIKALLRQTADPSRIAGANRRITGEGSVDLSQFYYKVGTAATVQLQKNAPVVGGAGIDFARGFQYLWDGTSVMVEMTPGGCTPGNVYYAIYCREQPAPGSQLTGDRDIFGGAIKIYELQQKEATAWAYDPTKPAWYTGGGSPWLDAFGGEVYCPNKVGCSALWVGFKSTDANGNPTWDTVKWPANAYNGKPFTSYDFTWAVSNLTRSGWRTDGLQRSGWRGFGLNVSDWQKSAWRRSGWKKSAWRDNVWS